MATGTYISIITLNVNELNAPTKRHRLAEQIQKQDSKRDTDVQNGLLDSVGEGQGGMIWENGILRCIL